MNPNCLMRADEIVLGDRNIAYGEPAQNHGCTAEMFSAAMRKKYPWFQSIDAEDVCWFNVCQKVSREMNSKTADGPVDVCGYTANVEIIRSGRTVADIRKERLDIEAGLKSALCENPGETVKPRFPYCENCKTHQHSDRVPCPKRLDEQRQFSPARHNATSSNEAMVPVPVSGR